MGEGVNNTNISHSSSLNARERIKNLRKRNECHRSKEINQERAHKNKSYVTQRKRKQTANHVFIRQRSHRKCKHFECDILSVLGNSVSLWICQVRSSLLLLFLCSSLLLCRRIFIHYYIYRNIWKLFVHAFRNSSKRYIERIVFAQDSMDLTLLFRG